MFAFWGGRCHVYLAPYHYYSDNRVRATGAEMAGKLTGKLNIFVCVMRELTTMECATLITAILRHPTPNSMLLEKDDLNDSVSFMEITI